MRSALFLIFLCFLLPCIHSTAQDIPVDQGQLRGNIQLLWQQYNEDTLINAKVPAPKAGLNAFGNFIYTKNAFSAGIRLESYLNAIQGYSPQNRFKGTGIGHRFVRYKKNQFEITIGNFYEQFGSGLTLRSYWEPNLGIDNTLDGVQFLFTPDTGIVLKAIYGRQRLDFDSRIINADGIVRGIDGEITANDFIYSLAEKKTRLLLGGSFVSKFQPGGILKKDSLLLELPENVSMYSGRLTINRDAFSLSGEYVEKINDPNADNGYIYKKGRGIFLNTSYSVKGWGIHAAVKSTDNLSFRSDRNLKLLDVPINYIPPLTKQHTYNLAATLYPYTTPLIGEAGYSTEIFYTLKKGTVAGGKYGTQLAVNFVAANSLDSTQYTGKEGIIYGYHTRSIGFGSEKYIRDFNAEIRRKISKKLSFIFTYYYLEFNTRTTPVTSEFKGMVYADIEVLEVGYKISTKDNLRMEFQALQTRQDKGDWGTVVAEYSRSPKWSAAILDQYNYGNTDRVKRIHYLYGTISYIDGASRLTIGYGKRREGVFCVGGVCRAVPATNGCEVTFTTSF